MATLTVPPYNAPHKSIPSLPLREFAITPSDADSYDQPIMIECVADGTIAYIPWAGGTYGGDIATSLTKAMVAGDLLRVAVRQVLSTGTTGTYRGLF